jgi:xanthine dehydrogenase YagS FAD-binding subunit
MQSFTYSQNKNTADAIKDSARHDQSSYLAGGTTLVDLMKLEVMTPRHLVDVNALPLDKIEEIGSGLKIGALVRNSELAYHDIIRSRYPVLSEALLSGATPQIRNMASVSGNLLQRTRCPYFRDTFWPCNKRTPGAGCSALEGHNRSHAVLGTSDKCIATHPSDMCVALMALDAVIHTQSQGGTRRIPIVDFFVSYGEDPARENVLQRGELITAVELPTSSLSARSHYIKARDRASFEFALASAAVALELKDGVIQAARLALGGVATKPWRSLDAEKVLVGNKPAATLYAKAAKAALQGARPQKFNAFKIELAQHVIIRTLAELETKP